MWISAVRLDLALTRVAAAFTLFSTVMFFLCGGKPSEGDVQREQPLENRGSSFFTLLVVFLAYGNIVYQGARFGNLERKQRHICSGVNSRAQIDVVGEIVGAH